MLGSACLQVLAHPRQICPHFDVMVLQGVSISNAAELQEVWSVHSSGTHNHLTPRRQFSCKAEAFESFQLS